mmetsp:Transcript_127406/g.231593  ORF Transcript_127406/g.231593 Transcript_127406/m.231593 type:complete len:591 (-) Transcript_127406:81-1853(-)
MAYTILVFLAAMPLAVVNAAEYKISSSWTEPSRTRFCPVHAPFSVREEGNAVKFVPPRRGAFSLAETSISLPAGDATVGLRMRVSASGSNMPSYWRFTLRSGNDYRFVVPVEVPGNGTESTVFLPWTAFRGQKVRAGGVDHCDHSTGDECKFNPQMVKEISVVWSRKNGLEEPSLILHEAVATSSSQVPPQGLADATCSCDADCVHCMALQWQPLVSKACASSTTSDVCLLARKSVAERIAAGLGGGMQTPCSMSGASEVVQWLASTIDVTNCMTGSPLLPATVLGDVLDGVFRVTLQDSKCGSGTEASKSSMAHAHDFSGPNVGWGITGHNDLGSYDSETADSCMEKCRANPECKSFDYGARGSVQGECWLSTADRISAASAYSNRWQMYDYYEKVTMSADGEVVNAGSKANDLPAERRTELLQGLPSEMQSNTCCDDPKECISKAIQAGAPIYNQGDHLGCYVIYHATAMRLAQCTNSSGLFPDARGMMHATAKTSEMDHTPSHAAWRLRRAFDAYVDMLMYSDPHSLQCKQRTPYGVLAMATKTERSETAPGWDGSAASVAMASVGGLWFVKVCLPLGILVLLAGLN